MEKHVDKALSTILPSFDGNSTDTHIHQKLFFLYSLSTVFTMCHYVGHRTGFPSLMTSQHDLTVRSQCAATYII